MEFKRIAGVLAATAVATGGAAVGDAVAGGAIPGTGAASASAATVARITHADPRPRNAACLYRVFRRTPILKRPKWYADTIGFLYPHFAFGTCRKYGDGTWRKVQTTEGGIGYVNKIWLERLT